MALYEKSVNAKDAIAFFAAFKKTNHVERDIVYRLMTIIQSPDTTEDEKSMALHTMSDALNLELKYQESDLAELGKD